MNTRTYIYNVHRHTSSRLQVSFDNKPMQCSKAPGGNIPWVKSWIIQSSARSRTFYSFMSSGMPQTEQNPWTLNWRLWSLFKAFHTMDVSFQSQDFTSCFRAFRLAVGIVSFSDFPYWYVYHKDTFTRCQREFHTGSKAVVLALHPELSAGLMSCSVEWCLKTVEPQGC